MNKAVPFVAVVVLVGCIGIGLSQSRPKAISAQKQDADNTEANVSVQTLLPSPPKPTKVEFTRDNRGVTARETVILSVPYHTAHGIEIDGILDEYPGNVTIEAGEEHPKNLSLVVVKKLHDNNGGDLDGLAARLRELTPRAEVKNKILSWTMPGIRTRRVAEPYFTSLDVTLRVPPSLKMTLKKWQGDTVSIKGMRSEVSVRTANGNILITDTSGKISASAGDNGNVTVRDTRGMASVAVEAEKGNVSFVGEAASLTASSGGSATLELTNYLNVNEIRLGGSKSTLKLKLHPKLLANLDCRNRTGELFVNGKQLLEPASDELTERRLQLTLNGGGIPVTMEMLGNGKVFVNNK